MSWFTRALPYLRPVGTFLLTWAAEPIGRAIKRTVDKLLNPPEKPKVPEEKIDLPPDIVIPQGEIDMRIEGIIPFIAPLAADYFDAQSTGKKLAEPVKRMFYTNWCCLSSEAKLAVLKSVNTNADDATVAAIDVEAKEEFAQFGHPEVPAILDSFVTFEVTPA